MKAILSTAPGGPDTLTLSDLPDPVPGPGQVLVAVRAVGVNYPDRLIIEDRYQIRPPRPFAPCGECAGVIEAVGAGVGDLAQGDRVVALTLHGALAEKVVADAAQVAPLPAGIDFETGAVLPMVYGTALHALVDRAALQAGETLLVLGAAGGVGLAAVELGRAMGARVVVGVSSEAKLAAARAAGAADGIVYPARLDADGQKALAAAFKDLCGKGGADVILDPVGGNYAEPALRAAAWGGRFLVVGFPAGLPSIPLNLPLLKGCDIRGIFWGAALMRDPGMLRRQIAQITGLIGEGKISPRIDARYPFAQGADAIARLDARDIVGKIVVTL